VTATLVVPAALRPAAGGLREIPTEGATVGQALDLLAGQLPLLERRLRDERGRLRQHVRIYLDTDDIFDLAGMETPVPPGAKLHIVPAVSGG